MELHLLKSTAILAILLIFYKLLLERENMHVFNRGYLLSSLIISIAVPFISFSTYIKLPAQQELIQPTVLPGPLPTPSEPFLNIESILWLLFAMGVLYFSLRFLFNFLSIRKKINQNPKVKIGRVIHVLLKEDEIPHTFLNYIFLNKEKFESRTIPQEVIEHEKAHALQKHTWDILLLELVQIVLWFHPLVYFLKKQVKLNHEFLADQAVLRNGISPYRYQQTLLLFSSKDNHSNLVHPINYSSIKKRFKVMKKQSSRTAILLRSLVVLPLIALLIYGFSSKETRYTVVKTNSMQDQKIATEEMVEEYNKLVAYYNNQAEDYLVLRTEDFARLNYIYNLMTPEQKKHAQDFPMDMFPPPPPPPPAPPVGDSVPPAPPTPPAPTESTPFDVTQPIDPDRLVPAPPPNPAELIEQVASEGARFWLDNQEVSSERALDIVTSGKDISIKVIDHQDHPPTVVLRSK